MYLYRILCSCRIKHVLGIYLVSICHITHPCSVPTPKGDKYVKPDNIPLRNLYSKYFLSQIEHMYKYCTDEFTLEHLINAINI